MKITKLGHCCLIIETNGVRILTDPGTYSTLQNEVTDIDIVLITHEHQDHLHLESLRIVLTNNPEAIVVTNTAVGKLLDEANISYTRLEEKQSETIKGVSIEGFGNEHEEIYKMIGQVQNTGYMIDEKFFYPGDSFTNPGKPVDILALPVAAPWLRIKESIAYVLEIKPRICFPVHDGILKHPGVSHRVPSIVLPENNIQFIVLEEGKETEL